jgi:hypothetical protein
MRIGFSLDLTDERIRIDASQSNLVFDSTASLSARSLMHNILLIACSILIVVLTEGLRHGD